MGSLVLIMGLTICFSVFCFGLILVFMLYTGKEVILLPASIRDDLSPLTLRIYNLLFTLLITAIGFTGTYKVVRLLLEGG
jgi:uncharacterized BrkB/YihY/UPF0761 family membrane protein